MDSQENKTENNDFPTDEDIDDIVLQPDGKSLCFQCGLEFPNMITGKEHFISVHHHEKNNLNELSEKEIENDESSFDSDQISDEEEVIENNIQTDSKEESLQNNSALAILSLLHSNQFQFNCDECSQCFQAVSELETHKTSQHGSFKTTCNVCNQEFDSSKNLLIHTGKDHLAESIQYVKKKMLHAN